MTNFVGRKHEIAFAVAALNHGFHLIIRGAYGIGKTSLAHEVSRRMSGQFIRVSISDAPTTMLREIVGRLDRNVTVTGSFSYKMLRKRLVELCRIRPVLIVDDIFHMNIAKVGFLRLLMESGAHVIMIVDEKAPAETFRSIANIKRLSKELRLTGLTPTESLELMKRLNDGTATVPLTLSWARQFHGHPLLIVQRMQSNDRTSFG